MITIPMRAPSGRVFVVYSLAEVELLARLGWQRIDDGEVS